VRYQAVAFSLRGEGEAVKERKSRERSELGKRTDSPLAVFSQGGGNLGGGGGGGGKTYGKNRPFSFREGKCQKGKKGDGYCTHRKKHAGAMHKERNPGENQQGSRVRL